MAWLTVDTHLHQESLLILVLCLIQSRLRDYRLQKLKSNALPRFFDFGMRFRGTRDCCPDFLDGISDAPIPPVNGLDFAAIAHFCQLAGGNGHHFRRFSLREQQRFGQRRTHAIIPVRGTIQDYLSCHKKSQAESHRQESSQADRLADVGQSSPALRVADVTHFHSANIPQAYQTPSLPRHMA